MTNEKRDPRQENSLANNNLNSKESQVFQFNEFDAKLGNLIDWLKDCGVNSCAPVLQDCLDLLRHPEIQKNFQSYYNSKRAEIINIAEKIGLKEEQLEGTLDNYYNSSGFMQLKKLLFTLFENNLEWDVMENNFRWRGKSILLEQLQLKMETRLDKELGTEKFARIASSFSCKHPYNAIQNYLNNLPIVENPEAILNKYFDLIGLKEEIHKIYFRKWLISAVARGMNPGCKADHVLILKSPQGVKKTSFFHALFGDLFQTYGNSGTDKDELMGLYKSWMQEYGEMAHTFSKKGNDKLKAFITQTHDNFRRPYQKAVEKYPRHFVFGASINDDTFLSDRTGNRRYWVVELNKKINLENVKILRDDLWSAIKYFYESGEQWWLTDEQEEMQKIDTSKYEEDNQFVDAIANYFTYQGEPRQIDPEKGFTMYDVMIHILQMNPKDTKDKRIQKELGFALRELGYDRKQRKINKVNRKLWFKSNEIK